MLLSCSLVLYIIYIDLVIAHSGKRIGKLQETRHEIVKKDIRHDGRNSDEGSSYGSSDEENMGPSNGGFYDQYFGYDHFGSLEHHGIQGYDDTFLADETDSQDSTEDGDDDEPEVNTRSLRAGDTFTPQELLPITIRLIQKVGNQGEGRGIVSSSKSPEDLADRLFGGYFLTMKRIVYLEERDLPGLDALQALALEGEDALNVRAANSVTEAPMKIVDVGGQLIGVEKYPGRCHYKLLYKKEEPTARLGVKNIVKENAKSGLRTGKKILKLEKKMRPNRHLVVKYSRKSTNGTGLRVSSDGDKPIARARNKKRRHHKLNKSHKKGMNRKKRRNRKRRQKNSRVSKNKKSKLKRKQRGKKTKGNRHSMKNKSRRNDNGVPGQATTTVKPKCKWRYHCKTPGDLDSCRLHTSCYDESKPNTFVDDIFVDHREDEHDESVKQFRKMLGITVLDEDVEKIIEQHVLQVKPENLKGVDKIETLDEYFNNIIMAQHAKTTTPVPNMDSFESSVEKTAHVVVSDSDADVELANHNNPSPVAPPPNEKESDNKQEDGSKAQEQQDETDDVGDEELRASRNKEKNKETNSTSQPPDKKKSSLLSISTTKSSK